MTNRKLHMRFRLAPRSMTVDDLELLQVRIFGQFRGISQIWKATTAKQMKIDSYCQQCYFSYGFSVIVSVSYIFIFQFQLLLFVGFYFFFS